MQPWRSPADAEHLAASVAADTFLAYERMLTTRHQTSASERAFWKFARRKLLDATGVRRANPARVVRLGADDVDNSADCESLAASQDSGWWRHHTFHDVEDPLIGAEAAHATESWVMDGPCERVEWEETLRRLEIFCREGLAGRPALWRSLDLRLAVLREMLPGECAAGELYRAVAARWQEIYGMDLSRAKFDQDTTRLAEAWGAWSERQAAHTGRSPPGLVHARALIEFVLHVRSREASASRTNDEIAIKRVLVGRGSRSPGVAGASRAGSSMRPLRCGERVRGR
jgi:hypothetical protein